MIDEELNGRVTAGSAEPASFVTEPVSVPMETGYRQETVLDHATPIGEEEDEERVMVGRFLDPAEAQMAKGMLEAAGIESFLQGENANAILPMAFRARLTVAHADEPEARALMASAGHPDDVEDELG